MRRKDQPDMLELIDQSDIWIDGQGVTHFVSKMDLRHIENARAYVMRQGTLLADQAYQGMSQNPYPGDEAASASFEGALDELVEAQVNPVPWLERSPLIQAFDGRLKEANRKAPGTRDITVTLKIAVPNHRGADEVRRSLERVLADLKWEIKMEDFKEGR